MTSVRIDRNPSRARAAASMLALIAVPCFAGDYFVAPSGRGELCQRQAPCSIEQAQKRVRAEAPAQQNDIRVNFLGGTYFLAKPIELVERASVSDSGHNGHTIIWQAAPGALAVLSGGAPVSKWSVFDRTRNIWRADAPAGLNARQLYVNGHRASRTITSDLMAGYVATEQGFQLRDPVFDKPVDISGFRNLRDVEIVRLFNWQLSRCNVTQATSTVIGVHPICLYNSRSANLGIFIENAFELLNKPGQWYLDRSGAIGGKPTVFYIPRSGEDMGTATTLLGATEKLLTMEGENQDRPIHDITIKGLVFSHATWLVDQSLAGKVGGYAGLQAGLHLLNKADFLKADAANTAEELARPPSVVGGFYDPINLAYEDYVPGNVSVNFARRVEILDNTFTHLGATALAMVRGIQDSRITGNVFSDVSGSAIQLGGVEQDDHHPCGDVAVCNSGRVTQNNAITNNRISDTAVEYLDTIGIFVGFSRNTLIANNELLDLPYSGISMGWGWGWYDKDAFLRWKHPTIAANNRIVNNKITRFLTRQRDGAAIYTLGAQPGSVIENNFATDGKNDFAAIYQDEGSSGFVVANNVATKVQNFLLINCNKNDVTQGNTYRQNYSETGAVRNGCFRGKNEITPPIVFTDRQSAEHSWPAAVKAITESAGLQEEFKKHGRVTSVSLDNP